jgi:hypothetical protein
MVLCSQPGLCGIISVNDDEVLVYKLVRDERGIIGWEMLCKRNEASMETDRLKQQE